MTAPLNLPSLGVVQDIAEYLKDLPRVVPVDATEPARGAAALIAIGPGTTLVNLREYLDSFRAAPRRRRGAFTVAREQDFLSLVRDYLEPDRTLVTVQFSQSTPSMLTATAILNYHDRGPGRGPENAAWADFRITYAVGQSDAFRAWSTQVGQGWVATRAFAEFIEERIMDLVLGDEYASALAERAGLHLGSPAEVIGASRGLTLTGKKTVRDAVTLSDGGVEVEFTESSTPSVVVPGMAAISIPLWEGGERVVLPVRLRYRMGEQGITWRVQLWTLRDLIEQEVSEFVLRAENALGVPVVVGAAP